jgi:hypothetical protein
MKSNLTALAEEILLSPTHGRDVIEGGPTCPRHWGRASIELLPARFPTDGMADRIMVTLSAWAVLSACK